MRRIYLESAVVIAGGLVTGLLVLLMVLLLVPAGSSDDEKIEALEARVATLEGSEDARMQRVDELLAIVGSLLTTVQGMQDLYEQRAPTPG